MDNNAANPVVIGLLFILRCLVPLLLMLAVSALLKRLGLIQQPTEPTEAEQEAEYQAYEEQDESVSDGGDLAHEKS